MVLLEGVRSASPLTVIRHLAVVAHVQAIALLFLGDAQADGGIDHLVDDQAADA